MNNESNLALIKIDATTEKEFIPDLIELTISFQDERETKEECIEQYNKDLETVLNALAEAGIDRNAVKQEGFKVYPKHETAYRKIEFDGDDKYYQAFKYINGYEYEGESSIRLDADPGVFSAAWLALLEIDGNFTFEFNYDLKDHALAEAELLREAVRQAKTRAVVLAEASDAKLGSIHTIVHSFQNAGMSYLSDVGYSYACADERTEGVLDYMVPDFNPADISVRCSVSCSWELER